MKPAIIPSKGIRRIPHLAAFLPEWRIGAPSLFRQPEAGAAVFGWGLRPSAAKARALAQKYGLPFVALEDGFLRSLGLGVDGWPPLSLVYDDVGIYYDTTRPSRLEQLLLAADALSPEILAQAQRVAAELARHRLSKYNHAPDWPPEQKQPENMVLVIDQTFGDMAVQYGQADAACFAAMVQAALHENPEAEVWIKTHPDVAGGKKRGYLTAHMQHPRVRVFADSVNPWDLLACADKVYCVTSQLGFEALLAGKPVVTFGLPWYVGWGLTDDRHAAVADLVQQGRRAPRTLLQLVAAAYLQYSRYINPNTGQPGTVFDVLTHLGRESRWNRLLAGEVFCVGMSLWKRAVAKPFLTYPATRLHFVGNTTTWIDKLPEHAKLLVWGGGSDAVRTLAQQQDLPLLRMEDGFIRSVGLGSNLVPPLSLVVDDTGIYFNPATVSRLENILQQQMFSEDELQAADVLQKQLIAAALSKYNVGLLPLEPIDTERKIILIPGQVEDDASILSGSPKIRTNAELLRTVRRRNPDAYIVYKPHPDVVSGNRIGHIDDETAKLADQIAAEADILSCLNMADEVHTMTSLTGFEALLRGKAVYCYGLPFYAGWGLTHDELPCPRRTRRLNLAQLVAGTLLHYPQYLDPNSGRRIDAFSAIDILTEQKQALGGRTALRRSFAAKQWGKCVQLYRALKYSR